MDLNLIINKNLEKNSQEILSKEVSWKKYSRLWGDKMHRICSYVAMFPPYLVKWFIKKYTIKNDTVLDTFSGRGTTLLQARLMNRKVYAIDLNPFAYVLTKAKSTNFKIYEIFKRINEWEKKYDKWQKNIKDINKILNNEDLKIYYSEKNLLQLIFIRETFGKNFKQINKIDNFILAISLGIMHGPMRKNGKTIYFSLSMHNAISMSPNYVKKYAIKKKLIKPKDNIFEKIKDRAQKILSKAQISKIKAFVKIGNALEISQYFPNIKPKLIFTSPPYLNLVNYTRQNWLKMWLLGFNDIFDCKKINLDDNHNIDKYQEFMKNYLIEISKICYKKTVIALVISDIKKQNKVISFEQIWNNMKDIINLKLINIYEEQINYNRKIINSLGKTPKNGSRIDKIYVFKLIKKL